MIKLTFLKTAEGEEITTTTTNANLAETIQVYLDDGTVLVGIQKDIERFEVEGTVVDFWMENDDLFCKVPDMGQEVYCCGHTEMPTNEEEVLKATEKAWVW